MNVNDINRLMDLDPLSLANADIEALIAYHRQQRGAFDQGQQPKKKPEGQSVSLSSMIKALAPTTPVAPTITRRRLLK